MMCTNNIISQDIRSYCLFHTINHKMILDKIGNIMYGIFKTDSFFFTQASDFVHPLLTMQSYKLATSPNQITSTYLYYILVIRRQ